ncbi:MAG: GAF domain-containing protein [bacterium]|nr:GAF domain-containing protein [bacterium]
MTNFLPAHPEEKKRLDALHALGILDTEPDSAFDEITKEVTRLLHVPISTISLIDNEREWYKSRQGLQMREGPRVIAFCSWALLAKRIFIVEDLLKDERFKDNPYVTGDPLLRFYAGVPLYDWGSRLPVGVLCAKDVKPRTLSLKEIETLLVLAKEAENLINNYRLHTKNNSPGGRYP